VRTWLTTRAGLPLDNGLIPVDRVMARSLVPVEVSGMRRFDAIVAMAAERLGGLSALEDALAASRSRTPEEIAATRDHRILAAMTRRISRPNSRGRWWMPNGTPSRQLSATLTRASMSEERFGELLKDSSIVRNAAKIRSVMLNGQFWQ
jgi:hypothetical protein